MRQAGRALKNYRELKQKHTFSELLYTPELAAEVTLLPEKDLGVDALILFSDILVVLEGMGVEVDYQNGGPKIIQPLKEKGGILKASPRPELFERVYRTIETIKSSSQTPLIGFCGGPLTVFLYLFQGSGHQGNFDDALKFFYTEPEKTSQLFETIVTTSLQYAQGQIDHGIDAFQIFETWAGVIPTQLYFSRVMPHIRNLAEKIAAQVPTIFFPRIFSTGYHQLSEECFKGISIDFITPLDQVSKPLQNFALQGNLDPHLIKYYSHQQLESYLSDYLQFYHRHPRWIVNLGHGVLPETPEDNLKKIVDIIKNFG